MKNSTIKYQTKRIFTVLLTLCLSVSLSVPTSIAYADEYPMELTKVHKKKTIKKKVVKKKTIKKKTIKKKVYRSTIDRLRDKVKAMSKQLKSLKSSVKKLKKKTKALKARKIELTRLQSEPINLLKAYLQGRDPNAELTAINDELNDISKHIKKADKKIKSITKGIKETNKTLLKFSPRKRHLTRGGGVFYYNGHRETWYSQRILPGYGLRIPGRHVRADGVICDKDGYVCVASPNRYDRSVRKVIDTSLGLGKAYDYCPGGSVDIYVNW